MEAQALAEKVVTHMYENDAFSQWLGIERLEVKPGGCTLRMVVRPEMTNGFAIAHGGISYSLADSCLAFASNSHGIQAVSVETSISHTRTVKAGDVLTAVSKESSLGSRIAVYHISVNDQEERTVALFKGTVFRNGKPWFPADPTT